MSPRLTGDGNGLTSANEVLRSAWVAPALRVGLVTQAGHHQITGETGGGHSLHLHHTVKGAMRHCFGLRMALLWSSFPHLPSAPMSDRVSWW